MVFCIFCIIWKPTFTTTEYGFKSNPVKLLMHLVIGFALWVRLKQCHRLLDRSLAGICNRSLLLSQLWVVSRKVVSQISCVAEVFKLSSTHLTNCVGLVNSPLDFVELKMLPYSSFLKHSAAFKRNVAAGKLISVLKFWLLAYLYRDIILLERIVMHERIENCTVTFLIPFPNSSFSVADNIVLLEVATSTGGVQVFRWLIYVKWYPSGCPAKHWIVINYINQCYLLYLSVALKLWLIGVYLLTCFLYPSVYLTKQKPCNNFAVSSSVIIFIEVPLRF